MSFLSPLFLLGLATLAIPVLIHLIQREKKQIMPFPSLDRKSTRLNSSHT